MFKMTQWYFSLKTHSNWQSSLDSGRLMRISSKFGLDIVSNKAYKWVKQNNSQWNLKSYIVYYLILYLTWIISEENDCDVWHILKDTKLYRIHLFRCQSIVQFLISLISCDIWKLDSYNQPKNTVSLVKGW